MATTSIRVKGYRECARAARAAGKATNTEVRAAFKKVAEPVRTSAASRFSVVDARSAAGFRVAVRQRGVSVEQRLKRTTGKHPGYGAMQMTRALLPALSENEDNIIQGFDEATKRVADIFERR